MKGRNTLDPHRPPPPPRALGSIRSDEIMPMRVAAGRLGWNRKSVAHAKRAGLKTVQFGRFCYVRGVDLAEFFAKLAANGEANGGPTQ